MSYGLRDDVSFCWIEGRPVFLDIQNDRYFQLPTPMEHAFIACLEGAGRAQDDLTDLVESNILTDAPTDAAGISVVSVERPSRSAFEQSSPQESIRITVLLEVFATVCLTGLRMRMRTLKDVLTSLDEYRRRRATPPIPAHPIDLRLSHAADEFRRARLYVPVDTVCLLDSLSMVRFLAKRGLHANIVFGVACDPFSAHCWVQAGDWVLNDTVGNVIAHTPIRVA